MTCLRLRFCTVLVSLSMMSCDGNERTSGLETVNQRTSIENYEIWLLTRADVDDAPLANGKPRRLALHRYRIPDVKLVDTRHYILNENPDLLQLSHIGRSFSCFGLRGTQLTDAIPNGLPNSSMLQGNAKEESLMGVLGSTNRYALTFLYAPSHQSEDCGMGYTRYRIVEPGTGNVLLDHAFCLHGLTGEFSGFVNNDRYLCYFVSREFDSAHGRDRGLREAVLGVGRDGKMAPQNNQSRMLFASPDGDVVVGIEMSRDQWEAKVAMYNTELSESQWTNRVKMISPDEFSSMQAAWSIDSQLFCILLSDGMSGTRMLVMDRSSGRTCIEIACPFNVRVCESTFVVVPQSKAASPDEYFGITPETR